MKEEKLVEEKEEKDNDKVAALLLEEEKEKEEDEKHRKRIIFLLLFLLVIVLVTIVIFAGISMSIFNFFGSGNTNNIIETGEVSFSYSDATEAGNGINIENAYPVKDSEGVLLSKDNEYFDFTVKASTVNANMEYEIVVVKQDGSTLDDGLVKIYLTEVNGGIEYPVPLVSNAIPTYGELSNTSNSALSGKTIYKGTVNAGEVAYGKKFRLRMWVKYPDNGEIDYDAINSKTYKVKVNVAAIEKPE